MQLLHSEYFDSYLFQNSFKNYNSFINDDLVLTFSKILPETYEEYRYFTPTTHVYGKCLKCNSNVSNDDILYVLQKNNIFKFACDSQECFDKLNTQFKHWHDKYQYQITKSIM